MITFHDLREVDPDTLGSWVDHIADNMRAEDRDEVAAMQSGVTVLDALRQSVSLSSHGFSIMDRAGEPVAIFGAAPHPLPGVGVVWMLGTDGIRREAQGIARNTRPYLDVLNEAYPILWNYIDDRNKVSLRWLKWGGFELIGHHEFSGHPFHTFARTRLHV
jgi:hypothetical protein